MQAYIVHKNQNIFDIAMSVHGSIEGIFDLLVNNENLSFDAIIKEGETIYYDEEFIVHQSIIDTLQKENWVPANSERPVYFKEINAILRCCIKVSEADSHIVLLMAGDGELLVDWGDNTPIETIHLQPTLQNYTHFFDNITDKRLIRLYGDFNLKTWDMSPINGLVLPTMPMIVDEFVVRANNISLDGLFLFNGTYSAVLSGIQLSNLDMIRDMDLAYLKLTNNEYTNESCIDDYLIYLATHNNERRNCIIELDVIPGGVYQEPKKDSNGNYIITSGMEAIYVIIHEVAWNEAGSWVFNINGIEYSMDNIMFNAKLSMIMD